MERPTLSIRSTKGCWTCRLRKKKCDEVQPGCLRCASVNIDCHYGPKPRWIEDPVLGKEELERVKVVVSAAASKKRALYRINARTAQTAAPVAAYPSPASPSAPNPPPPPPQVFMSRQTSYGLLPAQQSAALPSPDSTWLSTWIRDQEANLLMHYLDHVFYIQFRFHSPSITEGGRGWFLSLLSRTKPLYHAALSLSAFHQQSLMLQEQGEGRTDYLHELEHQHNLTLQELQVFIRAEGPTDSSPSAFDRKVQILACITLLISFELFHGGANHSNWQVHLTAGSELVLMLHEMEQPQSPINDRQRLLKRPSPGKAALKFFTGCILWFDILSPISTGARGNLAAHHRQLFLGPTPSLGHNVDMHTVCGAQNWVMILIGEIATLSSQRTDWKRVIDYNVQSFDASVADISTRLSQQHGQIRQELDLFRQRYHGAPNHSDLDAYSKHTVLLVTTIFAAAALIYLETIKSSDISPSAVSTSLRHAMEVFDMVPEPRMIRSLVWPLCVAGCVASPGSEQDFFKGVAVSAVNDSSSFGNSSQALEIMEKGWALQRERGKIVDCGTAVKELGSCVLLV